MNDILLLVLATVSFIASCVTFYISAKEFKRTRLPTISLNFLASANIAVCILLLILSA